jgi:hypothetical protein
MEPKYPALNPLVHPGDVPVESFTTALTELAASANLINPRPLYPNAVTRLSMGAEPPMQGPKADALILAALPILGGLWKHYAGVLFESYCKHEGPPETMDADAVNGIFEDLHSAARPTSPTAALADLCGGPHRYGKRRAFAVHLTLQLAAILSVKRAARTLPPFLAEIGIFAPDLVTEEPDKNAHGNTVSRSTADKRALYYSALAAVLTGAAGALSETPTDPAILTAENRAAFLCAVLPEMEVTASMANAAGMAYAPDARDVDPRYSCYARSLAALGMLCQERARNRAAAVQLATAVREERKARKASHAAKHGHAPGACPCGDSTCQGSDCWAADYKAPEAPEA